MNPSRHIAQLSWGSVSYLHWQVGADTDKPVVLLLHGGGVDNASLSWGEVGSALAADGYSVVAPDHPGYGFSPMAGWTATLPRLVDYVGEFVDVLGLRHYVVGGLSMGGAMSIGHALEGSKFIRGLMLLGSYGYTERLSEGPLSLPMQLLSSIAIRAGLARWVLRLPSRSRALMALSLRPVVRDSEQRTPALLDEVMVAARQPNAHVVFEQFLRDEVLWNRLTTNYTARLRDLPQPVLIIHGERDRGMPLASALRASKRMPLASLRAVEGAGHWVQRDRPDLVVAAMLDYLRALRFPPQY